MSKEENGKKRILVIEDELNMQELVKYRLEENNYEVKIAPDGFAALNMIRIFAPDLIILDLMLPKMDGYTVCRLLKGDERYRKIPIIMFTARTNPDDEHLGLSMGADAYIHKPFEPKALLDKIKDLLTKNEAPTEEKQTT